MTDLWGSWIKWQEDTLALQRASVEQMVQAVAAGQAMVAAQRAGHDAVESGMKAWGQWLDLWVPRR